MTELLWPFDRALWAGRIGRTKEIIIQSITDAVAHWRRYEEAQHTLMAMPQHLLDDFGICQKQIPTIAAYAAITQVNIAVALADFARLPPAPLPDSHVR